MLFNRDFSKLYDLAVTLSFMKGQKNFNQLLALSIRNDCQKMNEIGAKLRPVAWQQNLTTNKQTNIQTRGLRKKYCHKLHDTK